MTITQQLLTNLVHIYSAEVCSSTYNVMFEYAVYDGGEETTDEGGPWVRLTVATESSAHLQRGLLRL